VASQRTMSSRESAGLRHTLRTPINHMIGYTELLLEDPQLPKESEPPLARVLAAAQQTLTIVQTHLPGAEAEAQTVDFHQLRSDLEEAVLTVLRTTVELESIETGARLSDVRRIRSAAQELLAFAGGTLPAGSGVIPHHGPSDHRDTPARIIAKFLIVDDSDQSREILCRLLERQGHTCVTVSSGEEALDLLEDHQFDMVLLDLMMPGMNGLETLRVIKSEPKFEGLAVVMLSAFDEVGEIGLSLEAGAEDYLLKPFNHIVLNARLHAILERKRLRNLERRRALELELADAELRRSNEELRRFASVVSHDLQEPLRMVTSYMQLLKRDLSESLTEDQAEYLNFAIDGGRRMSELIQDLLSYSRVSAVEAARETVDFNEIVKDVQVHLRASIEESGARVIASDLPEMTADCSQIRQLFQNLVSNAIKYRGDKPPVITISAKLIDGDWLFSVADNGVGIDPENRQRIFEMFSRIHDRSVPGTGIGLAICQRVVERLGGRIWVESTRGQGSTFYFTIPK
jgi:light-regulated signal transduction histidine kinase (bacteriophytochrome)